jgi:hypothetical protein
MQIYLWVLFGLIAVAAYIVERKLDAIIEILEQIRDKLEGDNDDDREE